MEQKRLRTTGLKEIQEHFHKSNQKNDLAVIIYIKPEIWQINKLHRSRVRTCLKDLALSRNIVLLFFSFDRVWKEVQPRSHPPTVNEGTEVRQVQPDHSKMKPS